MAKKTRYAQTTEQKTHTGTRGKVALGQMLQNAVLGQDLEIQLPQLVRRILVHQRSPLDRRYLPVEGIVSLVELGVCGMWVQCGAEVRAVDGVQMVHRRRHAEVASIRRKHIVSININKPTT